MGGCRCRERRKWWEMGVGGGEGGERRERKERRGAGNIFDITIRVTSRSAPHLTIRASPHDRAPTLQSINSPLCSLLIAHSAVY
jgi:hypothetical protein